MSKNLKRNYPGDIRTPGTKDYSLILGNLISYRNKLMMETKEKNAVNLTLKIAEKLQELGFKKSARSIKNKTKSPHRIFAKKEQILEVALNRWKEGKEKNDLAKAEKKLRDKDKKD